MDRDKLRELVEHLDFVDDKFTHRVRQGQGGSLIRLGPEELERRQRDLADYVIELKDTLRQLLALLGEGG
jgi:hypothetical protein